MKRFLCACALLSAVMVATPVIAAPGAGQKVYGARLDGGVSEAELRFGRLTGGESDGEDTTVLELSHAISDRFSFGLILETEREPGEGREVEAYGMESIAYLGKIKGLDLDVALYGEFEAVRDGPNAFETKLLLQRTKGPFDVRINLIAEHELEQGAPLQFGYAASADWKLFGEFRLGAEAFGNLGSTHEFPPRDEHYLGPMVKTGIEDLPGKGELEIEAGYLFALGKARDETDGQFRIVLEYEFRF